MTTKIIIVCMIIFAKNFIIIIKKFASQILYLSFFQFYYELQAL